MYIRTQRALAVGVSVFWDGDKQKWTNGDTCDIYMVGTDVISGSSPE